MREIPRENKLEVAEYYILGYSYRDIEEITEVSHGSIVNIVKELEDGRLSLTGASYDQINDLRELSIDLKKKGLEPAQAQLGLSFFQRLHTMNITPELLDSWSELIQKLTTGSFQAKDFLEAALRLQDLEKTGGKTFSILAEEYIRLKESVDILKSEVESLDRNKTELIGNVKPLQSKVETLERTQRKLESDIEIHTKKLRDIQLKTEEAEGEKSQRNKETKDLQKMKAKLTSEIGGKEESLRELNNIGFSDEDLLRIRGFIERTSRAESISDNELKEKFFSALALFSDISGLENREKVETKLVGELIKKQALLSGEITELEKSKGLLKGEISSIISSTSQKSKSHR